MRNYWQSLSRRDRERVLYGKARSLSERHRGTRTSVHVEGIIAAESALRRLTEFRCGDPGR